MRSRYARIMNRVLSRRQEPTPGDGERRSLATRYGIEVLSSVMILLWGYNLAGAQGSIWAIITAVLILQPGIDNSMSASGVRIVATLLGASVGTAATLLIGAGAVALLAGILVTVILCYLVRLDLHVRQACLTVPIVQMWRSGSVVHVDYERITAILAGCIVPVIVQFAYEQLVREVRRRRALTTQKALDQSYYGSK
jgi:uncharacterized membrane protein YgaE (UPF0421/DUF939 family)